ncbi:MAG: hypothetical protein SCH39_04995 [Methanosarcinales archaeon]|nr:hypothetical protein [ANME-2 cluster archaeon]MDF1531121.1 hypothetical protein [ANME-2 cluster archaeon]MDW7775682.1 hypothetical protein [Methanosarcinales archaeon]
MIERELAWRVFAHEFNHSHHFFHEGDERSPNYLVTPTGARINRLYFVGVLTEIENIGAGEDMWRGRVSDHTGGFMVYAGQYQPEAAMFLSGLEIPSFVAMVGKARTYEPEEGTIYTSVRPEELNKVDSQVRDRWIVETARLTFERIRFARSALESGLKGTQLVEMLVRSGASAELADGITRAIEHYPDLKEYLDTLSGIIIDSLKTLLPDASNTGVTAGTLSKANTDTAIVVIPAPETIPKTNPIQTTDSIPAAEESVTSTGDNTSPEETQPDGKELVYELLGSLDKGRGVPVSELTDRSGQIGLSGEQVDDALKGLMSEGRCYEPRIGVLRRV